MAKVSVVAEGKGKSRKMSDNTVPYYVDQEWKKKEVKKIIITR